MIAKLNGKIEEKNDGYVVINVSGVGYKVFLSSHILEKQRVGKDISLWTHLVVRENIMDLYGFTEKEEKYFFELLIGISGIGPKSALSILSLAPVETLRKAILSGDANYLTKVSGIGKKSAEKIVLELKDKLGKSLSEDGNGLKEETEALEALRALGYSQGEARESLKKVPPEILSTNERIREALKILGK